MVVPYVNSIEKPNDSFIENADKNMTEIIKDPKIPDDLKMKLYHQNLNKFLMKYDPETYGITPTLTMLAKTVTDFIEKNKEMKNSETKENIPSFKKETPKKEFNATNLFGNESNYPYSSQNYFDMNKDIYKFTADQSINTSKDRLFSAKIK